ncbi:MAG: hypothetical protein FWE67_08495, partial [Planctomycetaceae bacterium]|nr:hypothetical protein [Planctomycetaceae bacterium]
DDVFVRAEIRREGFYNEHTEFAAQTGDALSMPEPESFMPERTLSENQYAVPLPPFGRNHSVPEQQEETVKPEKTVEAVQDDKNTATNSDVQNSMKKASKPKSGAVFGKPKAANQ